MAQSVQRLLRTSVNRVNQKDFDLQYNKMTTNEMR